MAGLAGTRDALAGRVALWGRLPVRGERDRFVSRWLDGPAAELGVRGADVARRDVRRAGHLTHEFYEQTHAGLPVIGSRLALTFGADGSLLHMDTRLPGELGLVGEPRLSRAQAESRACAGLAPPEAVAWHAGELAVLPAVFSGLAGDRVVWRLSAVTGPDPLGWRILVDARSGEILERRPLVHSVDGRQAPAAGGFTGNVTGWLHTPTPWSAYRRVALADELVALLSGSSLLEQQYTDANGDFRFEADPGYQRTLRLLLAGRYARVHIGDRQGTVPALELLPAQHGLTVEWDSLAASPAALAAYVHLQTAHNRLVRIDPGFTWLDRPVPVVVDDASASCNAYAYIDPQDPWLRFFVGHLQCANTARLADVVYHEYGHLATAYAYYPEDAPAPLHEAFSDYFAATIADTSAIGWHLFGPGAPPLRNLDNDLAWPVSEPCAASPHCLGLLLGSALWDLRTGLITSLGDTARAVGRADSLFHFMRAAKPQDFDACLVQLILQDDDDLDLSNGTPHLETIAAAFARHNIGDFSVHALHTVPPDIEDTTATTPIDVAIRSIYPPAPGGVRIHYALGDLERTCAMTLVPGSDRVYRWELPPQPAGTTLRYYITAEDIHGGHTTVPAGAPEAQLAVMIGPDLVAPTITHEQPSPPAAGQTGVWVAATVRDNSGPVASVSVQGTLGTPTGSQSVATALVPRSPEDSLYTGFLATGALAAGDTLRYHIEALDQARVPNASRFPAQQEILLRALSGTYWDLEDAPPGFVLSGDWARGDVAGDPVHAASGTGLLATQPAGRYTADTRSYAVLPELNLSDWSHGWLEFASWYRTEEGYDGGWIEASTNGGQVWHPLIPAGGYPGIIPYDADGIGGAETEIAAFTGDSGAWQRVLVPLDALVGSTVRLRLVFDSDELFEAAGWYVDDLKVLASQALIPPTSLVATSGEDERVALRWVAPAGIDEAAAGFAGYNIYRGTSSGDYAASPLNATPHRAHWWYDAHLENGASYYYAVTSVFDAGESAPSREAVGYPYRAVLGGDAAGEGVFAQLQGSATGRDTLWIANAGTGELSLELFATSAAHTWEEARPQFDLTPSSTFRTVARDPAGDAAEPDLLRLACRSTGDHLQLRIGCGGPLPDPRSAFTLAVFLDTDLKRATGIPGPNCGGEIVVVLGQDAYRRLGQVDVVIDGQGRVLGRPSHLILQAGLDSIEVAVPLAMIGAPDRVGIGIALGSEGLLPDPSWLHAGGSPPAARVLSPGALQDVLPGPLAPPWLACAAPHAVVRPGAPWGLPLAFDFTGLSEDEYEAQIWIASNDPGASRRAIPVVVALSNLPAEGLAAWSATSEPAGLRLAWAPADPAAFVGFLLARWEGTLDEEDRAVPVGGGLIQAPDGIHYQLLDRSVASGRRYYYRLAGVRASGDTLAFAPPAHPRYGPPAAEALVLEAARPNPLRNATALRVRAPEGCDWDLRIHDVAGRLVRRLVARGELGSGTHLIPWNGRTQAGTPAAAGVYYARLGSSRGEAVRSLLIVR